jgi:CRISPR/Cas system-associated exonuclease Cas4 (RecB family)
MNRIIWISPSPLSIARQTIDSDSQLILTSSPRAARALDRAQSRFKRRTLLQYARTILKLQGVKIAPILTVQRTLQLAIQETICPKDIEGTARKLATPLKMLFRKGIDLEKLAGSDVDRAVALSRVAQAYQRHLTSFNCIDPASILWRAAECHPDVKALFVYGYFTPELDELAFINAIAADQSHFFLPTSDDALFSQNHAHLAWLQSQGWQVESQLPKTQTVGETTAHSFLQSFQRGAVPSKRPEIPVHCYANREAEIRGTLGQVKQLLMQNVSPQSIALVARDEQQYGPMIRHIAQEYKIPIRLLYSQPLGSTRLGAWLRYLVAAVIHSYTYGATADLLHHILTESSLTTAQWPLIRQQRPNGRETWTQIGLNLDCLNWPEQDSRENWVERLKLVVRQFDVRRRSARWAKESVAFNQFNRALVDLARPEAEVIDREDFLQEVLASLDLLSVPAQPGRGGVELHGPGALTGSEYQHLFVLGMAEGILPKPIVDDPILDFYDLKCLKQEGLPFHDATDASRKEALAFYTMLQTATEHLTFSYPKLLDRAEALPSSYLTQLNLSAIDVEPSILASHEEYRAAYLRQDNPLNDCVLPYAVAAQAIESDRESSEPFGEYDGVIGEFKDPTEHVFSASQLVTIGQCPFKWFVQKGLDVADQEDEAGGLSPALVGQLYHKALEILMGKQPVSLDADCLATALAEAETSLNIPTFPAWKAKRQEHLQLLYRAIQTSDFRPLGAQVLALEQSFNGEWFGLKISGKVDRMDHLPQNDSMILIDYKTGKTVHGILRDSLGKPSLDIQMAIYESVAAPAIAPELSVTDAYYYSLRQAERIEPKAAHPAELELFADRVKQHLITGDYPVKPASKDACEYCSYDLVCRQGRRLNHKG